MVHYEDGDSEECKIDELKTILVDKSVAKEKGDIPTRVKNEATEIRTNDGNPKKNSTDDEDDERDEKKKQKPKVRTEEEMIHLLTDG